MSGSSDETCFIDTNVWLYALVEGNDPHKSETARELVLSTSPVVSVQVINEVSVNLLKQAALTEEQLRELVVSFYQKYLVVELTESILLHASELRERHSLSFWDSLILSSALASGAGMLYTEDMQQGLKVEDRLEIVNPFKL